MLHLMIGFGTLVIALASLFIGIIALTLK
ncbi:hypothetical protein ACX93W_12450 [Paenibacillus sp. CAU 1782]